MTYIKTYLKKDIVINSIITIHYFEYMKDFVFQGESHDFWEFLYVDKGSVIVQSGEEHLLLNTGDIIFHAPNEFHSIRSVGNASPNLVVMSFISHSPSMNFFQKKRCTLNMEERTLVSHLLSIARETLATPLNLPSIEQVKLKDKISFGSEQLILLYLELFLITVARNHKGKDDIAPKSPPKISPERALSKSERTTKIIQYLEYHICEHLTLSDICEAHSLSRSALQSLFHKEKGCGVMEYFNNMKIQRAKDIIRDGTMNFTEIAYFLSYSSLQYFSRQFKRITGMSPLEYSSSVKGISQSLRPKDTGGGI
ncbi:MULTISPECIES: AraC family transcriptional regulator [Sellimonas]|uniref:AraC family transcriptional regulator n=1 Tax=Sellimonas caecigallum TaxID=2592333 RepID=A0ABS7L544_9FIRM|nr:MULTISPECIES: AraC family transcriptional regulator [Sellimonas]MBY0758082.1 AraC family transcriptional regulator [Sellimonas caecigallum]OUP02585.1 AraC family transcriptional regulator [Drancourtella sp. An210]OUP66644.1 AraC family transcriptional regulator [Drancourtella sp. An177]